MVIFNNKTMTESERNEIVYNAVEYILKTSLVLVMIVVLCVFCLAAYLFIEDTGQVQKYKTHDQCLMYDTATNCNFYL